MTRDRLFYAGLSLAGAAIWLWFLLLLTAPPADAQERCTSQVFDPPLESGWAMPGDADTVSIMFADGGGITLVGPFSLGDTISHPGRLAVSLAKCSGSLPEPTPEPTPTVVPTPTPEPTPPVPEDQCCTTVVTPGPTATPAPIIPAPSTPPPWSTPYIPEAGTYVPPVPSTPELPATGATTDLLVVLGLLALAGGLMLATHRRWS
jgi:LPXTG-motif cell wall-anchored protein